MAATVSRYPSLRPSMLVCSCSRRVTVNAVQTMSNHRPLSTRSISSASKGKGKSKIQGKRSSLEEARFLPFDILPAQALNRSRAQLTITLAAKNLTKLRFAWEMFLSIFRLPNAIPDVEVIRWKPIYLPSWQMDLSSDLSTRLNGEEQVVELIGTDLPFPGTSVQPFASHNLSSPSREILQSNLQSFDENKHIKIFKQDDMVLDGEKLQDVLPIAFNLTPKDLPDVWRQVLSGIRDDDVRFTGQVETTLFAAYPIYMPYYLVNFRNKKAEDEKNEITGLLFGGMGLRSPPFTFWVPEEESWYPQILDNAILQLQAFRRNRSSSSSGRISSADNEDEEGASSSSFRSFSPRAAAQAAADSGSYDGSGTGSTSSPSNNAMKFLEFRKVADRAGQLVQESFHQVLRRVVEEGEKWRSDSSIEEVENRMQDVPHFLPFSENVQRNQEYINARSEVRKAIETVGQAKSMPKLPEGHKARVLAIQPKARFGLSFKTLDAAGLADMKKQAMKSAQKQLLDAETAAKNCKPSWLAEMEKKQA